MKRIFLQCKEFRFHQYPHIHSQAGVPCKQSRQPHPEWQAQKAAPDGAHSLTTVLPFTEQDKGLQETARGAQLIKNYENVYPEGMVNEAYTGNFEALLP